MAAVARPAANAARWEPQDFAFDPYQLTAVRLPAGGDGAAAASMDGKAAPAQPAGKAAAAAAAAAAPVKRRPGRQKRTSVLCQVPGCGEELVDAKKYYRRYRICQLHCNTPSMMIDGRRQRFCQQCGRFHDIGEFEGAKRSCKRKLKRHNERRRSSGLAAAGGKAGKVEWNSDSEAEAEEAYHESSGSELKGASATKSRTRRAAPTKQQPPAKQQATAAAHASRDAAHNSGNCSAASHDAGSGAGAALLAKASPFAAACNTVPGQASPLPHVGPRHCSPTDSLDSSRQQASPAELAAAAEMPMAVPMAAQPAPVQLLLRQAPHAAHGQQPFWPGQAARLGHASPALGSSHESAGPDSPLPAAALASAPTGQLPDADLDTVLQQLLQDEELHNLELDPLEILMPQDGGQAAFKAAPAAPALPPMPASAPGTWGAHQAAPFSRGALSDLPMELLDDIPFVPLPEELRVPSASLGSGSAGASGRSAGTVGPTPTASGGSADVAAFPMAHDGMAAWPPQQHMRQQWPLMQSGAGSAAPQVMVPQQQHHSLPPRTAMHHHAVSPSVMASAQGMLSVPAMVASGHAAPLVGYGGVQAMQHDSQLLTRLSLKVFSCTPDELLPAVRQELQSLLNVGQTLMEGCIRPGCVQLTLNALMTKLRAEELKASGLGAMVNELLASCGADSVLDHDMLVQFEGELAVVKRRKVVALIALQNSPALAPTIGALAPLAVHASTERPAALPLLLRGRHLTETNNLILARQHGCNLTVEVHATGSVQSGDYAKVRVLGLLPGFADLEVQHGAFLSAPRALLALPSAAAVAEVRQLELSSAGIASVDDFLRDMGLVVQYLQRHELAEEGHSCPHYTPALLACIAGKARELVAAAVARGWAATAEMLLPAVTADGQSPAQAVAAMDACCPSDLTLLHVAVGTGSVALICQLAAWGRAAGHAWEVDARSARSGVTPLHLAAMLANSADMLAALTGMAPAATKLWGLLQADDGTTPESLADAVQAAAAPAVPADQASPSSSAVTRAIPTGRAESETVLKASGSKAAHPAEEVESGLSSLSSSPAEEPAAQLSAASAKSKGNHEGGACPASCAAQRQWGRKAIKQNLEDFHMSSILSEIESSLEASAARDPRPLADVAAKTVAAGAAVLRALRRA